MKKILLFLLFFSSIHSIALGQSISVPTSILDLEKIIAFDENDYENYLKKNGFYYFKHSNGDDNQVYKTSDEVVLLHRWVESADWSLHFSTDSEERFNKIQNSLSASGYKLTMDEQGVKRFESIRNSCEVTFKNWDADKSTTFIFSCDAPLGRINKQKSILWFSSDSCIS